jgi:hypothetical protein
MPDQLRINDDVVDSLRRSIYYGGNSLKDVPALIKRVLSDGMWRDRIIAKTDERVTFDRFEQFVSAAPLKGLGASMDLVRNIVRDDVEAVDLLDRTVAHRQGERTDLYNNVKEVESAPVGNSAEYALRKLRKDAPELHARVIAGDLSPHGAMVEAGFRRRPVPLDQAKRAWLKMDKSERVEFLAWSKQQGNA